jgi:hypothetical protein
MARISEGLFDHARSEVSVRGRLLNGLGERLISNAHVKGPCDYQRSESSNRTSTADLTEPGWRHAGREYHDEKALVRAVTQGRGGFPGEVRQCSGKQRAARIRPFRRTSKARDERVPL